jgi:hypothetical protein
MLYFKEYIIANSSVEEVAAAVAEVMEVAGVEEEGAEVVGEASWYQVAKAVMVF